MFAKIPGDHKESSVISTELIFIEELFCSPVWNFIYMPYFFEVPDPFFK